MPSNSPPPSSSTAPPPSQPRSMPVAPDPKRRQYLLGTLMLLSVVFLWVSSSFIMNEMFTDMDYNKPFLITYICTSTFSMYLFRPAFRYLRLWRRGELDQIHQLAPGFNRRKSVERMRSNDLDPIGSFTDANGIVYMRPDFSFRARSQSRSISRSRPSTSLPARPLSVISLDPPLTTRQTAILALVFCGLWFAANWASNAALGYTSVSSTTILSSMSGFFTLAIGNCVGVEDFTIGKVASVVLSLVGVIVISNSDASLLTPPPSEPPFLPLDSLPPAPLLGDSLALLSALAYAFYVILLKVRIRTETRVSMTLFFGFVGAWNIVLIWPIGVVLHLTGIEVWEWPKGGRLLLGIAVNAMITFVSDALYLKAMLMTSPLAVTLGISLTIPLAITGDLYRGTPVGWKTLLGGVLVLGSFVANGVIDLAATESVGEGEEGEGEERERLLSREEEEEA